MSVLVSTAQWNWVPRLVKWPLPDEGNHQSFNQTTLVNSTIKTRIRSGWCWVKTLSWLLIRDKEKLWENCTEILALKDQCVVGLPELFTFQCCCCSSNWECLSQNSRCDLFWMDFREFHHFLTRSIFFCAYQGENNAVCLSGNCYVPQIFENHFMKIRSPRTRIMSCKPRNDSLKTMFQISSHAIDELFVYLGTHLSVSWVN